MALDPYTLCPCGSGKKIKFCCSDLLHEMEKVQKMLEGNQPRACLTHVAALEAKHPSRPSLLGLRAMLETQLGKYDEARSTLDRFLEVAPNNPIAHAENAILHSIQEEGRLASESLQKAIEAIGDDMPHRVYEAIGATGRALLVDGQLVGARAHFIFQAGLGAEEDTRAVQMLMRLNSMEEIPLLLKDDPPLLECPSDEKFNPLRDRFQTALADSQRGAWNKAETAFLAMVNEVGDHPSLWWNIAFVRGWQGNTEGMIEALRKFVPIAPLLDDAIEAEATAQTLDRSVAGDMIDNVHLTYEVDDVDQLIAMLGQNEQVVAMPQAQLQATSEGPPPEAVFWILDRKQPEASDDLKADDIPSSVAQVIVYGRETDRQSRIEVSTLDDSDFAAAKLVLQSIEGLDPDHQSERDVVSQISPSQKALSWSWRLPPGTTREQHERLMNEQGRKVLFQVWPEQSHPKLDGKSPREAAADPDMKVKVLAAILLLESASDAPIGDVDYNDLRKQMNLPVAETVDPATLPQRRISLTRLSRIDVNKLYDEELLSEYRRAVIVGAEAALRQLLPEVVRRESLSGEIDRAEAYGIWADVTYDADRALALIEQARSCAEDQGQSCANCDLAELTRHIDQGNVGDAQRLVQHLQTHHMEEPGVAQQLYQLLVSAGVISPDGTPAGPPPEDASGIVVPGGGETSENKLWTPGSEAPGSESPSKLWVPD